MTEAAAVEPRPFGRQPTELHSLRDAWVYRLERQLREHPDAKDSAVHVKAFWLRADAGFGAGMPDYAHAYLWIAPVVMSPALCELIESLVKEAPNVVRTGRGGGPQPGKSNPLRPFVYAVVDRGYNRHAG